MVEHRLAKAGVGGSNPLSRSKISSPSPSVSCASSFPRHDGAGGRPPSRPTYPPPSAQAPLARSLIGLSPPRRHSRGPHGNPVLDRILDSRLQRESQEKGSDKNRTGFPPSARMTEGRGKVIPCVVRVFLSPSFFVRHSRGPHGNPVLSCACLPSPVTMALGGDPPRDPLTPRQPSPLARSLIGLSPPRRHSRGPHGNPVLDRILDPRLRRE